MFTQCLRFCLRVQVRAAVSLSGRLPKFQTISKKSISALKGQEIEEEFAFLDLLTLQPRRSL